MTKLMPLGSFRWCTLPTCAKRWYTAHPGQQACPFCGEKAKDASIGWPHACSSGHAANHGGECGECRIEKIAKERVKAAEPVKQWEDR